MKKHFFALGGVTNTKDFYKKFPTEQHFNDYVQMKYGGMYAYNKGGQTLHPGGDGTYYQGNFFDEGGTTFIPEYGSAAYGLPQYNLGASYQDGGGAPVQQVPSPGPGQPEGQAPPQGSGGIDPQQVMQVVAQKLQQGEQPEQIMQELVQMGVPQGMAQQIIQQVIQQMQGGQNPGEPEPNGVQEYPEAFPPQAMYGMGMKYGGNIKKKYKVGGEYNVSNDDIKKLISQGYKIQYI